MGTRNITAVVHDGKIKISQYGQWDGYYSYTGRRVLNFCREHLSEEGNREQFIEKLNLCKQVTESFNKTMRTVEETLGRGNNKEFCIPLNQLFPQMSRDTGWKILEIINGLTAYEFKSSKDEETGEIKRIQFYPIQLCLDTDGEGYTNVIDLDNNMMYMLTCHEFTGDELEVPTIISKTYKRQRCYLKFSLDSIPEEVEVYEKVKEINIG